MAITVEKTIAIDDSRLSAISGENSTFFTGVEDTLSSNRLDIFVGGYAFIYWVDLPSWFAKDGNLQYFKGFTEKAFKSFNGVDNMTLNTTTIQTGYAGHELEVPTGTSRGNTGFSLEFNEYSGGVVRKMLNSWVSYISDPRTGTSPYGKLFDVEYGLRNHSGQLLYIVTRPDVNNTSKDIVEYAALYSAVVPKTVPMDHLNVTKGEQNNASFSIDFTGFVELGPKIESYAKTILQEKIFYSSTNTDGIIMLDSMNSENYTFASTSLLSDIYGSK